MNDPTHSRYRYLNFKSNNMYRRYAQTETAEKNTQFNNNLADIPAHGTYGALLFKPEWIAKRAEILNRDKQCVICQASQSLQVHHRQYHFVVRDNQFKMPWEYPENLLITLCASCHKRGHSKFKVPTINI